MWHCVRAGCDLQDESLYVTTRNENITGEGKKHKNHRHCLDIFTHPALVLLETILIPPHTQLVHHILSSFLIQRTADFSLYVLQGFYSYTVFLCPKSSQTRGFTLGKMENKYHCLPILQQSGSVCAYQCDVKQSSTGYSVFW